MPSMAEVCVLMSTILVTNLPVTIIPFPLSSSGTITKSIQYRNYVLAGTLSIVETKESEYGCIPCLCPSLHQTWAMFSICPNSLTAREGSCLTLQSLGCHHFLLILFTLFQISCVVFLYNWHNPCSKCSYCTA